MTLKANGKTKPQKNKVKQKVKCPFCKSSFKVDEYNCEMFGNKIQYYCENCGETFTGK